MCVCVCLGPCLPACLPACCLSVCLSACLPASTYAYAYDSASASGEDPDGKIVCAALRHLAVLRGVGPATASAVLAAIDPVRAPFMADEAMEAIPGFGLRKYTLKAYSQFRRALVERAESLQDAGW